MKKLAILAVTSLMIGGVGTAAMAQSEFTAADGNKDYQISISEAMGAYSRLNISLFNLADADGDGWLDEGEFYLLGGLGAGL